MLQCPLVRGLFLLFFDLFFCLFSVVYFVRFVDSAMGGISFFQSAYWSFTVMSTIGFGDYSPTTVRLIPCTHVLGYAPHFQFPIVSSIREVLIAYSRYNAGPFIEIEPLILLLFCFTY